MENEMKLVNLCPPMSLLAPDGTITELPSTGLVEFGYTETTEALDGFPLKVRTMNPFQLPQAEEGTYYVVMPQIVFANPGRRDLLFPMRNPETKPVVSFMCVL